MTNSTILGLNAIGFNTASALIVNGKCEFAVEEERLTREKRTRRFPESGIRTALAYSDISLNEVDTVAIAWNPAINLEAHRATESGQPRFLGEIFYSVPSNLMALNPNKKEIQISKQSILYHDGQELSISYVNHHIAHAASFFVSPFEKAAILTIDAFGEKHSVTFSCGTDNQLKQLWGQQFPHTLGSFYSSMTAFCGFRPQAEEWKLMGASGYGDPSTFYSPLRALFHLEESVGFKMDLSVFNFHQFHLPGFFNEKLESHLGLSANTKNTPLSQNYFDIAAATQRVTEEVYLHMLRQLYDRTKLKSLVVAGGVALNCVANGKILAETPFNEVFIPPVPDDSGGSLGAAFYVHCHVNRGKRDFVLENNYLGPSYSDHEIMDTLERHKIVFEQLDDPAETAAQLIFENCILGWFQGRLEFGDRALGNRSILADPRDPSMKDRINSAIKFREHFRPFAPMILEESLETYFENASTTPYMEKAFEIRSDRRAEIPAVTHVDGTARLQTVSQSQNPLLYRLIAAFERHTTVPIVLNTSFNIQGEPIVCSPNDAVRTFYSCGLDALIIGPYLIRKGN